MYVVLRILSGVSARVLDFHLRDRIIRVSSDLQYLGRRSRDPDKFTVSGLTTASAVTSQNPASSILSGTLHFRRCG